MDCVGRGWEWLGDPTDRSVWNKQEWLWNVKRQGQSGHKDSHSFCRQTLLEHLFTRSCREEGSSALTRADAGLELGQ